MLPPTLVFGSNQTAILQDSASHVALCWALLSINGPLLSTVTVFFNLDPFWIESSSAPLCFPSFLFSCGALVLAWLNVGGVGGGGGPGGGGGGGGMMSNHWTTMGVSRCLANLCLLSRKHAGVHDWKTLRKCPLGFKLRCERKTRFHFLLYRTYTCIVPSPPRPISPCRIVRTSKWYRHVLISCMSCCWHTTTDISNLLGGLSRSTRGFQVF